MAKQTLNIGAAPDDGTGDTLRAGGDKIQDNFDEIYTYFGDGSSLTHLAAADPHPQYLTATEADLVYSQLGHTHTSAGITDFTEATQDVIGALLVDSTTIDVTYNDAGNSFTMGVITTGLSLFNNTDRGVVPGSGGGTTAFLRADGTWATPTASAADPSYSPGSFTVATETGRYIPNHLKLTSTQRATLQGTGRLVLTN